VALTTQFAHMSGPSVPVNARLDPYRDPSTVPQRSVTTPLPARAVSPPGGCGAGGIGRAVTTLEAGLSPEALVARSRKSYVVPFCNSDTVWTQQVVSGN
jgi:hypothetical protein